MPGGWHHCKCSLEVCPWADEHPDDGEQLLYCGGFELSADRTQGGGPPAALAGHRAVTGIFSRTFPPNDLDVGETHRGEMAGQGAVTASALLGGLPLGSP